MKNSFFKNTPTVNIIDNRGLEVRTLQYLRHPDSSDKTEELITMHQYSTNGFLSRSADPRLAKIALTNITVTTDLTGNIVLAHSVDSGSSLTLSDSAKRPFIAINQFNAEDSNHNQSVTRTWHYEATTLLGRPIRISEQLSNSPPCITERFVYSSNSAADKENNLAGECIYHYDTTGLVKTESIALTGESIVTTRRLLKPNLNADVDWQGEDTSEWNKKLEATHYTSLMTTDATGATLLTTDATNNHQRVAYDIAGFVSSSWLKFANESERIFVSSLTYSANGEKQREVHGNGVITTYHYEPQTQRLLSITTERPIGHPAGAKKLQDLHYDYDPVGNIVHVNNDAEETRYWNNQKILPESTYVYDSLYQLVSATGRELVNANQQKVHFPTLVNDLNTYTNYTRNYHYDIGGNLYQIRHSAHATQNNYTVDITVSDRSNRAVLNTLTTVPSEVDSLFTIGGQQKQLQKGQQLSWTMRNELQKVVPVTRDGAIDDSESYYYDANSQRTIKNSLQSTNNSLHQQQRLYLPSLEIYTRLQDGIEKEKLHIVTPNSTNSIQIRGLHWENGKPDSINNNQLRYSYSNHIGSHSIETDTDGYLISSEEYYPYGGTSVWVTSNALEASYKTIRYSGKELDNSGLYYYGYRYYQPWIGRWLSSDPAGTVDGLNLYRMVRNNPITLHDDDGRMPLFKRFFDKNYVGKMSLNSTSVEVYNSPWDNSYQVGNESRLTFQKSLTSVTDKTVTFNRSSDQQGFNQLYQNWHQGEASLIRGISSSHFSWNEIITDQIVRSEGDVDTPMATMGASKSRWLPTALDDESNRIMVSGIARGNHVDMIKDVLHKQGGAANDVLAGTILKFNVGINSPLNINFLYDGEIVVQGPVHYPDFRIDSLITGDILSPGVDASHLETYDDIIPLSAPYLDQGVSRDDPQYQVAQDLASVFLVKGANTLAKLRNRPL